jgi:hypothetical protein
MKRIFFILVALAWPMALLGQAQTSIAPDCSFSYVFSAVGNSPNYDNRSPTSANAKVPCKFWSLTYLAEPTVTATTTLAIQGAPDSSGAPGTFASLATDSTLPNASVSTSGTTGYYPWMRIRVTAYAGSGNIYATLNGWRDNAATIQQSGSSSSGCPGTLATPCVIAGEGGATPSTIIPVFGITPTALSVSGSGLTKIISNGGGSTQIRVTHISMSFASSVDWQLEYGTGTNCGTGTTALTGVYKSILTIALDFDLDPLLVPAADDLCVNLGSGVTGGGLAKSSTF